MKMVKSLILGSAAGLIAMSGAQAADLPVKAKAVEYVKICSLYGAGFYYIPGTDTCIKLGGYLRVDTSFNASGAYDSPAWAGAAGQQSRNRNYYTSRARQDLNIDTRTATEYGVVRTYFDATFNWTSTYAPGGANSTDGGIAGGALGVYYAFIQFAGFTMGKAVSQYSTPWTGYPGNNTSFLIGGQDDVTGINQLAYTTQFGNGVSGTISLEDQSAYTQSQLYNVNAAAVPTVFGGSAATWLAGGGTGVNNYGGNTIPDVVGQLRVDQAWGLFQLSAAAHNIHANYYNTANETFGHPSDKYGFAVMGAISIKNIPTGPGDTINVDGSYADGATRYVIGGVSPNAFSMFGGSGVAYQSIAVGSSTDGIYGAGGGIEKTKSYGVRGAFNHNWDAFWSSSLFGSYSRVEYNGNAKALYCAGFGASVPGQGATYTCDPNFSIAQIGMVTRWTPVKNLTFSGEAMYTWLDQSNSGTTTIPTPGGAKPAATYQFKDQGTVTVGVRAQRTF